jgi:hypothetical protein
MVTDTICSRMEGNRKGYGSYKNMKRTMQEFDTVTIPTEQT